MKNHSHYHQLIPVKVHEKFAWIANTISPKIKGYSDDNLKEVLSIISWNIRKDGKPSPIHLGYLKQQVPQGDKYLNGLREVGVILRSGRYVKGVKCYKYNFAPEYQSKYHSIHLRNTRLVHRIERIRAKRLKASEKQIAGHSDQIKNLRSLTITDGYLEFINVNYSADTHKFNLAQSAATRIMNGDVTFKIDTTAGRFHSNLTNMPRGLRKYLRINGEQLVEIDIRNCQPFLSILLLTNPSKVSGMTKNPELSELLLRLKVQQTPDVKQFIDLVVSGQFYEFLTNEFILAGITLPEDPKERRDAVKKQVLRILFAKNKLPKNETNRKARQVFINRFPKVHSIFSKVRGNDRGSKIKKYPRFAILLQRIEAYLILDVIIKRIYADLPGTIAVTIHDSILTGETTNRVNQILKIMSDELFNYVGYAPQIKVEYYSNSSL